MLENTGESWNLAKYLFKPTQDGPFSRLPMDEEGVGGKLTMMKRGTVIPYLKNIKKTSLDFC